MVEKKIQNYYPKGTNLPQQTLFPLQKVLTPFLWLVFDDKLCELEREKEKGKKEKVVNRKGIVFFGVFFCVRWGVFFF